MNRTLRRYEFPIVLCGYGTTPDEVWEDALEGFFQDPGTYDEAIKLEQEKDLN
jgi:hypothetical protein